MRRLFSFAIALIIGLGIASTLRAEADPLTVVPDDVLGVGLVNHLADANARILKLTQKMQLPIPGLLPTAQLFTGLQQGLDYKGTLAVALFSVEDDDGESNFVLAYFVPTTDYKALITQLKPDDADAGIAEVTVAGSDYVVAHKGDFGVFVDAEQKPVLEKILASTTGVAATLARIRPWVADQQIALVATPAGKKVLFETIDGFLGTGVKAFGQIDEEMQDDDDDKDAKDDDKKDSDKKDSDDKDDDKQDDADKKDDDGDDSASEMVSQLKTFAELMEAIRGLLPAAEEQLTELGVGIRIDDKTSLHVSARALFKSDGDLSQWSKTINLPKGGLLAGLPAGKFVLAYGAVRARTSPEIAKLINWAAQSGLSQLGLNKEQAKKYFAILDRQRANQLNSCGMFGNLRPGDSLASTSLSVEYVKDAREHVKLEREGFELLEGLKTRGASEPVYTVKDVMVGDLKAVEVTTNMNALTGGDNEEAAEKLQGMFGKLFGSGGVMQAYIVAADDHTVVTAYSKEMLTRGVAHVRSGGAGLEKDEQIAKTTGLLPDGSQWAAYINPQGLIQLIDSVVREMLPGGIKIPPFPPSDPIGLAARVNQTGLDAELVLPDSTVVGIGQYIGVIQKMFQGNEAELP